MTDDRAEKAFARAFDERSDDFRPLDADEIMALSAHEPTDPDRVVALHRRGRRTAWLYGVAAVAAFVLCLPFLGLLLGRTTYSSSGGAPAAAPPVAAESARASQADAAGRAPARSAEVDAQGCPVRTPEGRPLSGAIADLTRASSATVCQYAPLPGSGSHLVGSRSLGPDQAQALLEAALAAPIVVPADPLPACTPTREELVILFDGSVRELRLPLDGCRVFVLDDGVSLRAPTRALCGDLLTAGLSKSEFLDPEVAEICSPR